MSLKRLLTFDFGRLRIALFEHIFTTGIGLQSKKKNTVEKMSTFTYRLILGEWHMAVWYAVEVTNEKIAPRKDAAMTTASPSGRLQE